MHHDPSNDALLISIRCPRARLDDANELDDRVHGIVNVPRLHVHHRVEQCRDHLFERAVRHIMQACEHIAKHAFASMPQKHRRQFDLHHAFAKIRPRFSTINGADPVHIVRRLLSTYRTQFHCQGTETLIPTRNTATLFEVVTVGT